MVGQGILYEKILLLCCLEELQLDRLLFSLFFRWRKSWIQVKFLEAPVSAFIIVIEQELTRDENLS